MTSSRDDERRRVTGQTSQYMPDPGRDFDPWHDYLQLGRLVNPNYCSLGWAGRTSLSLDIEEDNNGTPNCYKDSVDSVENTAFRPATASRLFLDPAGRRPHCVSEGEFDLNSVESIAFSPATSSRRSSPFSATAGRRLHCVSEEEFDLNSAVESIAFSPATSTSLFSDPTVRRTHHCDSEEEFNSLVASIALATPTSIFSDPTGRRPHCVSEEEEFDLNSVESIAFSPATSTSLFSATDGRRSSCVSEESMSSVSDTAQTAIRRPRPRRFSVETPTSPSSASSVSDTVGVVGAGGGGGGGGDRPRRPPRSACCRFCKQNGESDEVYLSHSLRCEDGRVTCPVLRRYTCPTCNATGDNAHTRRYCPLAQVGGAGGGGGEQSPVLPETGGALWVLDWNTSAFQFEKEQVKF